MKGLDPRLTPARGGIADVRLRGLVEADRFVEPRPHRVEAALLDLRSHPRGDAGLATQLLHGERVGVYDDVEGWALVQADRDGYVGYVASEGLREASQPSHRVIVKSTFVYPAPDMKRAVLRSLPLDARVAVTDRLGEFCRVGDGYIYAAHLAPPLRTFDFVEVAAGLIGTPYLWGGKSAAGIDCSGLVQLAASMSGIALPRDTDMQEEADGYDAVEPTAPRRRGDLVFWPGHVGIMSDEETLLHANGFHMLVAAEPCIDVERRIARGGSQLRCVRRRRAAVTDM